jgi:predicted acyltransferase (DUF342 family)
VTANVLLIIIVVLFIFMICLPALPMLKSMIKKEDTEPLYMDMDYVFNPRFQAESFEESLIQKSGEYSFITIKDELTSVMLPMRTDKMPVFISEADVSVRGTINLQRVTLSARGRISVQKKSHLYALKSDDHICIGESSIIEGWIDSKEKIIMEKDVRVNLVTAKSIELHSGVRFKRIFADTIGVFPLNQADENKTGRDIVHEKNYENVEAQNLYLKDNEHISSGKIIHSDVICRGDLVIENGCKVLGSVKTNGSLLLGNDVQIYGNIFSDANITIQDNCFVFGNLFSHGYVRIGKNGQFGRYSHPKSIIGIKGVAIGGGTFVHNYILTYGEGKVI